jgi:WG containing repeat
MKNSILILCLFAVTSALSAQNPRIETIGDRQIHTYKYTKGGDSVRFTIVGKNDTVQVTDFYRSGKTESVVWKKDSSYRYNLLGRLTSKRFGLSENDDIPDDSTVVFYKNGQIKETSSHKNNVSVEKNYNAQGKVELTTRIQHAPSVNYTVERDRKGVLIRAKRTDTLMAGEQYLTRDYDTLYFDNGRVFKTSITNSNYKHWGSQEYNIDGSLSTTELPDSLQLIEFKDNVDCYYGLKNNKGDTVVKPRFDRIQSMWPQFWRAYTGNSLIVLDRNGAPVSYFPPNLTNLSELYPISKSLYRSEEEDIDQSIIGADNARRQSLIDTTTYLYAFSQGDKHGVVTAKGEMVMPPQYLSLSNRSVMNGRFFHFQERADYDLLKSGFLTPNGKPLFSSDDFKTVMYANYEDYFFLSQAPHQVSQGCSGMKSSDSYDVLDYFEKDKESNTFGLGKSDGRILLERKYNGIAHIGALPLFITTLYKKGKGLNDFTTHEGIYNCQSKRWLLDSIGFEIQNVNKTAARFFVVEQLALQKYGIMDTAGKYVLPLAYDSIGIADDKQGLFWVKKGGKYQVFEIKKGKPYLHKTKYDFLAGVHFDANNYFTDEDINYFFAQSNGLWGLIDAEENTLKPFEYDYVSKSNSYGRGFIMVKNNQAAHFTPYSLPNPMPDFPHAEGRGYAPNKTGSYQLANNTDRVFIINGLGNVLVPPQYKAVNGSNSSDYMLIEDDKKQRKLVFLDSGKLFDFPFTQTVAWASPNSKLIIVRDSAEVNYGVVTTDGALLAPCKNYGVAIGDVKAFIFFVKQDTPTISRPYYLGKLQTVSVKSDSLNLEDNNWLMYDGKGALISDKPFRFPIDFNDGVGIGVKDDLFNLYKTNGSILTPFVKNVIARNEATEGSQNIREDATPPNVDSPQRTKGFNNIRRDEETEFYALFYNQGLSPTLILTKPTGEIVVNSGRYNGVSNFFGKYALVSAANKIGLIDTLGQEVIAPQDLRTYAGNFIDSLDVDNKNWRKVWAARGEIGGFRILDMPIESDSDYEKYHPDSLLITDSQRSILWNLLLDKSRIKTIKNASDINIERADKRTNGRFFSFSRYYRENTQYEHRKIIVEANTVSYILEKQVYNNSNELDFYNFYRKNGRWEELNINDLLNIQGDKRWQINDLITKKVKALKDQEIDCSNTAAFITTVENRWMFTKTGIDFCFDSTKSGSGLVVIAFTWAELTPFLKMKIY